MFFILSHLFNNNGFEGIPSILILVIINASFVMLDFHKVYPCLVCGGTTLNQDRATIGIMA